MEERVDELIREWDRFFLGKGAKVLESAAKGTSNLKAIISKATKSWVAVQQHLDSSNQ